MTRLEEIHAAVVAAVGAATGLSAPMIVIENQDRDFIDPTDPRYCLITYGAPETYGTDDLAYEPNETTGNLDVVVRGTRRMVATLAFESFDQTPDRCALVDAMKVIDRQRMPSFRNPLKAAGIAIIGFSPPTNEDYDVDAHMISRYTTLFTFAYGIEERPESNADTTTTVETVEVSGTIEDTTGDPLPDELQFDEEISRPLPEEP